MSIVFMMPIRIDEKRMDKCKTPEAKEAALRVTKRMCYVLWAIKAFMIIGGIWFILVPFALDLPCIVKKEYPTISGTVVERTQDNRKRDRIKVKDKESGEIKEISIPGNDVEESYEVEMIYMPHLKIGEIKRRKKPQTATDRFWEFYNFSQ